MQTKWIIQIHPNNRYYLKIFTPLKQHSLLKLKQYSLQTFSIDALKLLLNHIPCGEIVVIPNVKVPDKFRELIKEAEKKGIKISWEKRF